MATVEVTEENFAATVQKGIVVLDFWAGWCGPCRAFAPVFEAAAERHPEVVFGKIDTEAQPALAATFQIRSIPTLMIIRDGVLLARQAGSVSGATLDRIVEEVTALDMEEIRRHVDEDGGGAAANDDA